MATEPEIRKKVEWPHSLEITTKIGCQIACAYCPQGRLVAAYSKRSNIFMMGFDTFKKCIDEVPPYVNIDFAGMCEPWLNPECTKMILYAHKKGHKLNVFTILVGMKPSDIDSIKSIPFERFDVHLPSGKGYEKIKIDDNYLKILNKICNTKINNLTYHTHLGSVSSKIKHLVDWKIEPARTTSRAGNVEMEINNSASHKKKGLLKECIRLHKNILLPNGDVVLCCMDYGLKHVLGNLISSDYESLFKSKEFLKIKKGLKEDSDILCRYCEMASNENLFAIHYYLYRLGKHLINIRSKDDLKYVINKLTSKLKKIKYLIKHP